MVSVARRVGTDGIPVVIPRSDDLSEAAEHLMTLKGSMEDGDFERLARAVAAVCRDPELPSVVIAARKSRQSRDAIRIAIKHVQAPALGVAVLRTNRWRRKIIGLLCRTRIPSLSNK